MKKGLVYILLAMISIQFGATVAKPLFMLGSPLLITTLRISFAALMMWVLVRPFKKNEALIKALHDRAFLKNIIFYGGSLGAMNILFYLALQKIPLGIAVTVEFIGPLLIALIYSKSKKNYFWMLLSVVGLGLLFYPDFQKMIIISQRFSHDLSKSFWGLSQALIAGLFWALYIFYGKKVSKSTHSLFLSTTLGMSVAALVSLFVCFYFSDLSKINNIYLLEYGVLVALLSSLIPYSLEMKALKIIPESFFGILMSLEPVIACLMGYLFLNETLTLLQMVSIVFVMTACAGVARNE